MAPLAPEIPMITLVDILTAVPFAEHNILMLVPQRQPESYNLRSVCRALEAPGRRGRHQAGSYHGATRRKAEAGSRAVEAHVPRRGEGQPATGAAARQRRVYDRPESSGGY